VVSFAGGNFILGGVLLDNQEFKDFGVNLTLSYYQTYHATATGIGPELFEWVDNALPVSASQNPPPPANQTSFYNTSGFWVTDGHYIQRPETMESLYYAYRLTGDRTYQQLMWAAFQAVATTTRAGSGYACLDDVNIPGGGGFLNFEESFLYAEVLKYSYLAFAGESEVQFQPGGKNQFVFNTEGHPLKVRS
jgi:mannosyl-oligosaccharide alpha-1,2-mannosidase